MGWGQQSGTRMGRDLQDGSMVWDGVVRWLGRSNQGRGVLCWNDGWAVFTELHGEYPGSDDGGGLGEESINRDIAGAGADGW